MGRPQQYEVDLTMEERNYLMDILVGGTEKVPKAEVSTDIAESGRWLDGPTNCRCPVCWTSDLGANKETLCRARS